jgi:hypothetical protein
LAKLDDDEKVIKSKADAFNKLLQSDDNRLTEDGLYNSFFRIKITILLFFFEVRSDINAVIGEVNLLLRGKLKQFRGLCQANVVRKKILSTNKF